MPTLSMGSVNIWRIFSPAVWAATATLPRLLMAPCMTTAPMAETEYSKPMGRPMMQSFFIFPAESVGAGMKPPSAVPAPSLDASLLDARAPDAPLPDRQITPVFASSHQAFKTPLTS